MALRREGTVPAHNNSDGQIEVKLHTAQRALQMVEPGMTLRLGSGSTATLWIKLWGNACAAMAEMSNYCERPYRKSAKVPAMPEREINLLQLRYKRTPNDLGLCLINNCRRNRDTHNSQHWRRITDRKI